MSCSIYSLYPLLSISMHPYLELELMQQVHQLKLVLPPRGLLMAGLLQVR